MKARIIAYWIATALLGLGMGVSGVLDLLHLPAAEEIFKQLGYPSYLLTIVGVAKPLGALIVLAPGLPRLKEWAYAGLTIDLIGATSSHAFSHHGVADIVIPWVFMAIGAVSYCLRPAGRRLPSA